MAGLIKDDGAAPVPAEAMAAGGGDSKDPFSGDSQRFTWPRELEMGQLQAEVTEALGPDVRLAAFFNHDEEGAQLPVSADRPVVIYVTPSSADLAAVKQVLAVHKPDPYYGMSPEQVQQEQLKAKIASGQELSAEEMQAALRMLISG